jgi:predicted Rossmann fold flavoprotein
MLTTATDVTPDLHAYDVVVLGAGASGMMCAIEAGKRGRSVALIDHAGKVGGKIIISGGGRCNFTNRDVSPRNYVSKNPHFCKSALSRYTSDDFVDLVRAHGIAFEERKWGQLFCERSAQQIIDMLVKESGDAGARFFLNHKIDVIEKNASKFLVKSDKSSFSCDSLVVATGGLSIPKVGATGFGYHLARQFGLNLVETAPALDGFIFGDDDRRMLAELAGIALDSKLTVHGLGFHENILFTHVGLSGPAALQASLHWHPGDTVSINFIPSFEREELLKWFTDRKTSKVELKNLLGELVPKRLAERLCARFLPSSPGLANLPKKDLEHFCEALQAFAFIPAGTVGYSKAEVTRGGVDTDELSSKTMESKKVPGLFFIGEVVDVTGWLGGYNFQWAWSSGWAAGQVV